LTTPFAGAALLFAPLTTCLPAGSNTATSTVMFGAADWWFSIELCTRTVARASLIAGVLTKVPQCPTWTAPVTVMVTFR